MNWKILAWQKSRRNLLGRSAFHYTMHEGHRKPLHLFLSPISDLCRVRLLRSQNQSSAILWLFPQVLLSIGAERQRIWLRLLYSKQNRKSSAAHGGLSLCHAAIQTGLFFFLNRYTRCALHHMLFCVTANTFMWFSVAVTATSEMTTTDREDRGYIYLKFTSTCSPLSKKKKKTLLNSLYILACLHAVGLCLSMWYVHVAWTVLLISADLSQFLNDLDM